MINWMRELGDRFPMALLSDSADINAHLSEISALALSAVFVKPVDIEEIYHFLMRIAQGNPPRFTMESGQNQRALENANITEPLDSFIKEGVPLLERLENGLKKLVENTAAECAILFRLDQVSNKVSIVASSGSMAPDESALHRLIVSPVKDIIVENGRIFKNHIQRDDRAAFKNLLALLPFNSCIGIPVPVWGKSEHALFIFHQSEKAFSATHQQDAVSAAALISSALERQKLVESLRPAGAVLLSGELTTLFNHEVLNALSSININMDNLKIKLAELEKNPGRAKRIESLEHIQRNVQKIGNELSRINLTAEQFQRVEKVGDDLLVDLNTILEQIIDMVTPLATRGGASIQTDLAPNLPRLRIPISTLYHVFLNVILNAIQQMAICPKERRILTISTSLDKSQRFIQVRFKDSGPGIHKALWQEIFSMGFTTRKDGQGLGLFISKMLLDTVASRITVEDSTIAIGSTFLVEIPTKK